MAGAQGGRGGRGGSRRWRSYPAWRGVPAGHDGVAYRQLPWSGVSGAIDSWTTGRVRHWSSPNTMCRRRSTVWSTSTPTFRTCPVRLSRSPASSSIWTPSASPSPSRRQHCGRSAEANRRNPQRAVQDRVRILTGINFQMSGRDGRTRRSPARSGNEGGRGRRRRDLKASVSAHGSRRHTAEDGRPRTRPGWDAGGASEHSRLHPHGRPGGVLQPLDSTTSAGWSWRSSMIGAG